MNALELVENSLDLDNEMAIILHQEEWHPGVIGIVASRLVEKYYRPTIMLTTVDGVAKGSARSISNFDIYEALQKCEGSLIHFGGHKAAAGLAIEIEKLKNLERDLTRLYDPQLKKLIFFLKLHIDSELHFSDITPKFLRILELFSPFGPGNMRPVFLSKEVSVVNTPRIVGNDHILCRFKQNGSNKVFDCIGFNMESIL